MQFRRATIDDHNQSFRERDEQTAARHSCWIGAKKLGGGCFSTVIIFIILWYILGHFGIFK